LHDGGVPAFAAEPSRADVHGDRQATIAAGKEFEQQRPAESAAMSRFTESLLRGLAAVLEIARRRAQRAPRRLFAGKRAAAAR